MRVTMVLPGRGAMSLCQDHELADLKQHLVYNKQPGSVRCGQPVTTPASVSPSSGSDPEGPQMLRGWEPCRWDGPALGSSSLCGLCRRWAPAHRQFSPTRSSRTCSFDAEEKTNSKHSHHWVRVLSLERCGGAGSERQALRRGCLCPCQD